jgi:hypothetical protein
MMKTFRAWIALWGLFLLSPDAFAQYTLEYVSSGNVVTLTGYTGTPVAVTVPSFVNNIGEGAFANCSSLSSITIPDTVTNIGDFAFELCTSLTSVTMADGVTNVGADAFSYCTSLAGVTIPAGVTGIAQAAFSDCANLTSITIPATVTSIGFEAFAWCASLTNISVDGQNPNYSSLNGVLFDKNQLTLIQYPVGNASASYVIPSSVTTIADSAFYNCANLNSVIIPSGVSVIGEEAFQGSGLSQVTVPGTVTAIGNETFAFCPILSSVIISGTVTSLGDDAFYECPSLIGVLFAGNAPTVDSTVFQSTPATAYYLEGTTGWAAFSSNAGIPAVLWNPAIQNIKAGVGVMNNLFGFTITGTTNIPILIEASTNLAGALWTPVLSCHLTNGSIYFSDPSSTNYGNRFYSVIFP